MLGRLGVLLATALEGFFAPVTIVLLSLIPLAVSWGFSDSFEGDFTWRVAGAISLWALSVGAGVKISGQLERFVGLGEQAFFIHFLPLGLTLITLLLAVRLGRRSFRVGYRLPQLLVGTGFYALSAWMLVSLARWPVMEVSSTAIIFGTLVYGLVAAISSQVIACREPRDRSDRLTAWLRDRLHSLPVWLLETVYLSLRVAFIMFFLQIVLAAALLAGLLVGRAFVLVQLYDSLHASALGLLEVTLVQIALLPNLVIWLLAWFSGIGFSIGPADFSPLSASYEGILPNLPILGALPNAEWLGWWVTLVPIVLSGAAGLWLALSRQISFSWGWRVVSAFFGNLLAGAALTFLQWIAGGHLGSFSPLGTETGWFFLFMFMELSLGSLLAFGLVYALAPSRMGAVGIVFARRRPKSDKPLVGPKPKVASGPGQGLSPTPDPSSTGPSVSEPGHEAKPGLLESNIWSPKTRRKWVFYRFMNRGQSPSSGPSSSSLPKLSEAGVHRVKPARASDQARLDRSDKLKKTGSWLERLRAIFTDDQ